MPGKSMALSFSRELLIWKSCVSCLGMTQCAPSAVGIVTNATMRKNQRQADICPSLGMSSNTPAIMVPSALASEPVMP